MNIVNADTKTVLCLLYMETIHGNSCKANNPSKTNNSTE